MEFGILGPLMVRDGAEVHPVPAAKERVLLAALLVRQGQPAPLELLADTLWDGRPPRSAPTTLRNYVMRLRNRLGSAGERIETRAGGYLIQVAPGEFDVQRFAQLRDLGVAALRVGQFARAATVLDEALGLWRGPALLDVPSDALWREEGERLTESRLAVLESRLEAEIRLGRHGAVIAELRALTATHPGRERFWVQLMTALYRSGRQSEALAAYRQVRQILDEEIGVEPGSELREVHQRILGADPALDEPAGHPVSLVTPFQLPCDIADFTGRCSDVSTLTDQLTAVTRRSPFLAVLSGQPGVGKSALARHVAHTVRAAFPDGTLFADLRGTAYPATPPCEVLETFLLALGVPAHAIPPGLEARTALYRSVLAGRRVLVVLDDVRDSTQVTPLLPSDPASAALVTSRHRLADLAGAQPYELDVLTADEARLLLGRIVGQPRLAADPVATMELTGACGRLPLALRICAARLAARPSWSVRHLADRLADQGRLFDELRVGNLDVRAAFALSHEALEPSAARAFRLLSLPNVPTVRIELAAELLGEPVARSERLLECLVDAHLLVAREPGSYRYPALLRAFAREQSLLRDTPQLRSRALVRAARSDAGSGSLLDTAA